MVQQYISDVFRGKIDVLKGSLNFSIRILFLPLTSSTFSILRSIMHLHCRSGLKTSAVLTKNIFIPHNLRRREQFYTWCCRRARTGTCSYHTEDIFRSALNFTGLRAAKSSTITLQSSNTVPDYWSRYCNWYCSWSNLNLLWTNGSVLTFMLILPADKWPWGPLSL